MVTDFALAVSTNQTSFRTLSRTFPIIIHGIAFVAVSAADPSVPIRSRIRAVAHFNILVTGSAVAVRLRIRACLASLAVALVEVSDPAVLDGRQPAGESILGQTISLHALKAQAGVSLELYLAVIGQTAATGQVGHGLSVLAGVAAVGHAVYALVRQLACRLCVCLCE